MTYRHSSYRKLRRAVAMAEVSSAGTPSLPRTQMDRVLHWTGAPAGPKPPGWGKAKGSWDRLPAEMRSAP